ncbi:hypothetical protein QFZ20_004172 [Flavobacterium sp. W4I14]|nr:hypothetical protein [Flavobacterium sp. W4I14]
MSEKIFCVIILFLTMSCGQNKDKSIESKKNMDTLFSIQWNQIKNAKDRKDERELVVKFIKSIQTKGYGVVNPTYINYNGKTVSLSNLFDEKSPEKLKSVSVEILDRTGKAADIKLTDWNPLDHKSAILFLQE